MAQRTIQVVWGDVSSVPTRLVPSCAQLSRDKTRGCGGVYGSYNLNRQKKRKTQQDMLGCEQTWISGSNEQISCTLSEAKVNMAVLV